MEFETFVQNQLTSIFQSTSIQKYVYLFLMVGKAMGLIENYKLFIFNFNCVRAYLKWGNLFYNLDRTKITECGSVHLERPFALRLFMPLNYVVIISC